MFEALHNYNGTQLLPFLYAEDAKFMPIRFQANQTILQGQPVAIATNAVNAVQTITVTATGGSGKLQYGSYKTVALAHNADAAAIQAALTALAPIGTGNVAVTGSGPWVVTFQGALAGQPVPLITVPAADNAWTGGTWSLAHTTVGVIAGGGKAWTGSLVAPPGVPTVSAQSGGSIFGDGTATFGYVVTVTFYNASGETTPSKGAPVTIASTNRTIRVAAYTGVDANITGANYYVNGVLAGTTAVSGGNIAQTDLTTFATTNAVAPSVNGCYAAVDGSHGLLGFSPVDLVTDDQGRITLGGQTGGQDQGQYPTEVAVWIEGFFRMGDLAGITSANGPQLSRFGRFLTGDYSNAEGIYRLGA